MSFIKIFNLYKEVGDIHREIKDEIKDLYLVDMKASELIYHIEQKILEKTKQKNIIGINNCLGFPIGISVNNCCAHWTISSKLDDIVFKDNDLVKIDFGINNKGFIVDSALTIATNKENDLHEQLNNASQEALYSAIKMARPDTIISEIGAQTHEIIESYGFNPVNALCGHKIMPFKIHADKVIPNIRFNFYNKRIEENEIYAIEPFVSNKSGNSYMAENENTHYCVNYNTSKEKKISILDGLNTDTIDLYNIIDKNFKTLPFCDNWLNFKYDSGKLHNKLDILVKSGILNNYPPIYENNPNAFVSQFEHTVAVLDTKTEILT